jgi:hypothetical protein
VFRFSVIHEFVAAPLLEYGEQQRLLEQKCARKWVIPCTATYQNQPGSDFKLGKTLYKTAVGGSNHCIQRTEHDQAKKPCHR